MPRFRPRGAHNISSRVYVVCMRGMPVFVEKQLSRSVTSRSVSRPQRRDLLPLATHLPLLIVYLHFMFLSFYANKGYYYYDLSLVFVRVLILVSVLVLVFVLALVLFTCTYILVFAFKPILVLITCTYKRT